MCRRKLSVRNDFDLSNLGANGFPNSTQALKGLHKRRICRLHDERLGWAQGHHSSAFGEPAWRPKI
jgi:hypothetical protein